MKFLLSARQSSQVLAKYTLGSLQFYGLSLTQCYLWMVLHCLPTATAWTSLLIPVLFLGVVGNPREGIFMLWVFQRSIVAIQDSWVQLKDYGVPPAPIQTQAFSLRGEGKKGGIQASVISDYCSWEPPASFILKRLSVDPEAQWSSIPA